jgi:hypothetical protein
MKDLIFKPKIGYPKEELPIGPKLFPLYVKGDLGISGIKNFMLIKKYKLLDVDLSKKEKFESGLRLLLGQNQRRESYRERTELRN